MTQTTSPADNVLVTGFGPFLTVTDNPSEKIARSLGHRHEILEVSFEAADRFVSGLDPDSFTHLLMLGVATGRTHVCPELFARNQIGHTKDVQGVDRFGPIEHEAPLLLQGNLWTSEIAALEVSEPTIRVSMDAGSYLCNYIYYRALRRFANKKVGFLHVVEEQTCPLQEQVRLAGLLLEVAVRP